MIPVHHIVIVYLIAAFLKFKERQYEHGLTRFFLALAYLVILIVPLEIEQARAFSRWFVLLVGLIEVLSWIVRKLCTRRLLPKQ